MRQTKKVQITFHHRFQRAVGHIVGAGFIKTYRHLRIGHQRRAFGDVDYALVDILGLVELRRANQVQHFGIGLHHVGRYAAGLGDRIVQARLLHDVLAQKIRAGVHQRHRVQRAAPEMRRVSSMRRHAFEVKRRLNIGEGAEVKHAAKAFRVPGHGSIDIIKQPLAHHKGFTRAALLARAAVKAQRAASALFCPPGFDGESGGQAGGTEQVMAAAVTVAVFHQRLRRGAARLLAQTGQRIKLAEDGDHRLAVAD